MSAKPYVAVVTGASRGIGLEFVKQLAARTNTVVYACVRNPNNAASLKLLSNTRLVQLDVTDQTSIKHAVTEISKNTDHINLLINNAGIAAVADTWPPEHALETTVDNMTNLFHTNVIGVMLMSQTCNTLLHNTTKQQNVKPPIVLNISSGLGSITNNNGKNMSYRVSKTALNQLTKTFAKDVPDVIYLAISPGWVQTDMGQSHGRTATETPTDSVNKMLGIVDKLTLKDSGNFVNHHTGELYPL